MSNPNYDALIATTLKHYIPKLADNIFQAKVLLHILQANGRIKNFTGTQIVQPLLYAQSPNVGSFSGADTFATSDETGISAAEFPFRQFYGLLSFEGITLAKNSGKEAVLSLMDSHMAQLEMTMAESLNTMLFGDGTGNTNKDFYGLKNVVAQNDTWGGIDRSANAYWEANTDATASALTLPLMRSSYMDATEGNDQPTNILTTQAIYEGYEGLLQDNVRYENTDMGDAGFVNLMYKRAPVAFDRACTASYMYFLNVKYLTLAKLNNVWFTPSDWLQPVNQDKKFKHVLCYGNLVSSNNSRQSVLTALTNS